MRGPNSAHINRQKQMLAFVVVEELFEVTLFPNVAKILSERRLEQREEVAMNFFQPRASAASDVPVVSN
jgi:hypothetical protein